MSKFLERLKAHAANIPGWKTNRQLVVIESDDWGTIRMSSKQAFSQLVEKGYPVAACNFGRNDGLESNDDLSYLFDVLSSVKDRNGNPGIFTMNNIVANPDFEKIKASNYQEYFYEPFFTTLERYPCHDKVQELYREGISHRLIKPQFHGREHVHVNHWLSDLAKGAGTTPDTFELNMFTVYESVKHSSCNREYLNAMATYNRQDMDFVAASVADGLNLFETLWGFRSKTVIAPCYNWHSDLEKVFAANGIKGIQSGRAQVVPTAQTGVNSIRRLFMGQRNVHNQRYSVRNVTFEPAIDSGIDVVSAALKEIETAFFWKKPAIISSHRLNYIGWLTPSNRETNLKLLRTLLHKIVNRWPEVEFITSDELTELFDQNDTER